MRPFRPKRRNPVEDGLPISPDEWDRMPAEVEQAYRRGFQQGLAAAVEALRGGATVTDLQDFIYGPVHRWRFADPMRWSAAPEMEGLR